MMDDRRIHKADFYEERQTGREQGAGVGESAGYGGACWAVIVEGIGVSRCIRWTAGEAVNYARKQLRKDATMPA